MKVFVVVFYYRSWVDEAVFIDRIYGVYSSEEKAKAAAIEYEKEECKMYGYDSYSITEFDLDVAGGDLRDL